MSSAAVMIGTLQLPFPAIHKNCHLLCLSCLCILLAYSANIMDPDQTAPKRAVWSGFIVFDSMFIYISGVHLNICSRCNKQMAFSEKKIYRARVNNRIHNYNSVNYLELQIKNLLPFDIYNGTIPSLLYQSRRKTSFSPLVYTRKQQNLKLSFANFCRHINPLLYRLFLDHDIIFYF